jgi:3-hydroxyisobutyrate dehydrogenase-like beta-hydroxyacid dehydrogenase
MAREVVGFIGLGDMGRPMAANLRKAGYPVTGYDVDVARLDAAAALGIRPARSCTDVARASSSVLISMVRTVPQTEAALFGEQGVLAAGATLTLVIMSTLDPGTASRIAERLAPHQIEVVDAPVSGGVAGAQAGTLSIMLSGANAAVERVRPLLGKLGGNIFYLGETPGMAQAAKLANQVALAVNMMGVFEGLQLARRYGIDADQLMPLLSVSTGGSWVTEHWDSILRYWASEPPGPEIGIIEKDLRSSLGDAADLQLPLSVAAAAFQRLRHAWPELRCRENPSTS